MIPDLDGSILTCSCHPAAIVAIGTGCGDYFPPLLGFRFDTVFVFLPLGVHIPQSHSATNGISMHFYFNKFQRVLCMCLTVEETFCQLEVTRNNLFLRN